MAIRKVILTESELTNLIRNIVIETQNEMGEGWLGDKMSDIKQGGREFFTEHKSKKQRDKKGSIF